MNKGQLHPLTSLRFFAAAMIVIGHGDGLFGSMGMAAAVPYHQAVSFFFVLSGFILSYNYPGMASSKEVWLFYATRLARIWPAHVATALIALWFTPRVAWLPPPSPGLILLNIFLLQAWVPSRDVLLGLNLVSWALSVEISFYLFFPVIMRRWRERWHWLLAGAFLLAVGMVVLSNLVHLPRLEMTPGVSLMGTIYMNPLTRLFEFVLGIATAALFRAIVANVSWTSAQATVVELGALILLVLVLRACKTNVEKQWLGEAGQYYILMQGAAVMWAGLIIVFAIGRGRISRILAKPLALGLGEMSFALFLVHTLVLRHFELYQAAIGLNPLLWCLVYWSVCLIMAYALFVGIEQPVRLVAVALIKQKIRPELQAKMPPRDAVLKPMAVGASLFLCLFAAGYWVELYVPVGG